MPTDSFPTLSKLHHLYNLEVNHNHSLNQDNTLIQTLEHAEFVKSRKAKKSETKQGLNVA